MGLFWGKKKTTNANSSNTEIDEEILSLVDITVNKIAPKYVAEIMVFIGDYHTKIEFQEFNESYSGIFKSVITESPYSAILDYNWALNYYPIKEKEAELLRRMGNIDDRNWSINITRRVNQATRQRVAELINNHNPAVNVYLVSQEKESISFWCKPN